MSIRSWERSCSSCSDIGCGRKAGGSHPKSRSVLCSISPTPLTKNIGTLRCYKCLQEFHTPVENRRQLNIWKEELFQLTAQTCLRKERMLNPPRTNFPVWLVERRHQSGDRSHLYLNAFERNPVFMWKIDHFSVPNHPLRFIQIRLKAVWEKWIQAVLADLLMGIFVLCFPERVHICLFISQDVWMMYFSIMSVCGLVCMDFRVLNVCIILEQISICHWHRGKGSQCLVIKRARGCFLFFNRESLFFFFKYRYICI